MHSPMKIAGSLLVVLILHCHQTLGIVCPNHKDRCPSSTTCCEMLDGNYGCCPYANAMCCQDNIHCCPSGSTCSTTTQACQASSGFPFEWMVPLYTHRVVVDSFEEEAKVVVGETNKKKALPVPCPDGNSCLANFTCCQMPQGNYGCCPHPSGVCCNDRMHCCPNGYNCDVNDDRCIKKKGLAVTEFMYNFVPREVPIYNFARGYYEEMGPSVRCAPNNLCSLTGFVCCPQGQNMYCCPQDTVCGLRDGQEVCVKETKEVIPKISLLSALNLFQLNWGGANDAIDQSQTSYKKDNDVMDVDAVINGIDHSEGSYKEESDVINSIDQLGNGIICPDQTDSCPSRDTCCEMENGRFGCCPMPKAICCSDMLHCCPSGYKCGDNGCERKPYLHLYQSPAFTPLRNINIK